MTSNPIQVPKQVQKIIRDTYNNPKTGLNLSDQFMDKVRENIKNKVRDEQYHDIGDEDIKEVLNDTYTHSLFTQVRNRGQSRTYSLSSPYQVQIDLTFYSHGDEVVANENNIGIFVAIDIASRYAFAFPIKSKTDAEMYKVMNDFLESYKHVFNRYPEYIQTDFGSEFNNKKVTELMKKHNIRFYQSPYEKGNMIVERFNLTLRKRLNKMMAIKGSLRYLEFLNHVITGYNSTIHSTLKMSPIKAVEYINEDRFNELESSRIKKLNNQEEKEEIKDLEEAVGSGIKETKEEFKLHGSRSDSFFKIGDKVHVEDFSQSSEKTTYSFTLDKYIISRKYQDPITKTWVYYVNDINNKPIPAKKNNVNSSRGYYNYQLKHAINETVPKEIAAYMLLRHKEISDKFNKTNMKLIKTQKYIQKRIDLLKERLEKPKSYKKAKNEEEIKLREADLNEVHDYQQRLFNIHKALIENAEQNANTQSKRMNSDISVDRVLRSKTKASKAAKESKDTLESIIKELEVKIPFWNRSSV